MGIGDFISDTVSGGIDAIDDLFSGGTDVIGSIGGWLGDLNPSIASAGIFSAASMVSELFGTDIQEDELDFLKDKFEQANLGGYEMLYPLKRGASAEDD
jgi:hypothetical protein